MILTGLATVGALAVPPLGAVAINHVARGAGDGDVRSGDGDEGALPFLVAKGSGTLENDLEWRIKCQRRWSRLFGPRKCIPWCRS